MCDEGIGLKELSHKTDFDLGNLSLIKQHLLVIYIYFYMEIKVRSKYSMTVFLQRYSSEPNCTFAPTAALMGSHLHIPQ